MTDEEIAAIAAALLVMMTEDEPARNRQPASPWGKAARDYGDDDACSLRF
jgi:hypothetical protein